MNIHFTFYTRAKHSQVITHPTITRTTLRDAYKYMSLYDRVSFFLFSPRQQKPEQPCKSYTPLGALSSMQPPGSQGNHPNMSPRRHSAFSAPHQHGESNATRVLSTYIYLLTVRREHAEYRTTNHDASARRSAGCVSHTLLT